MPWPFGVEPAARAKARVALGRLRAVYSEGATLRGSRACTGAWSRCGAVERARCWAKPDEVDAAVDVAYRYYTRCRTYSTWARPTRRTQEIEPALLLKLPADLHPVALNGCEPPLGKDLTISADMLAPRGRYPEIPANGHSTGRLVEVRRAHRDLTARVRSVTRIEAALNVGAMIKATVMHSETTLENGD